MSEKYVLNSTENIEKLVKAVMAKMSFDTMWESARQGLINHYIDNNQHFLDDYYEIFPDEDPDNSEDDAEDKVIYYHGHHSNACIVGEIYIPEVVKKDNKSIHRGFEVIAITHKKVYEDYGDDLRDITKLWDAQVQVESYGGRYDTHYDTCIHIPLDMGEHTSLSNKILKQILIDNGVSKVMLSKSKAWEVDLNQFFLENLGLKG